MVEEETGKGSKTHVIYSFLICVCQMGGKRRGRLGMNFKMSQSEGEEGERNLLFLVRNRGGFYISRREKEKRKKASDKHIT